MDRPDEFVAAMFMGPKVGPDGKALAARPRPTGQATPEMLEQAKQMVSEAVAAGIEEGARRVERRYSTVGTIVVGALVVTAAATATLAVLSLLRGK